RGPPGGLAPGAAAGQPQRFEEVYLREFPRVFALAYALSGSRWAAEDISQDAFVVAHQQWGRVGGFDDPGAWVRRVAANLAVSAVGPRPRAAGRFGAPGAWVRRVAANLSVSAVRRRLAEARALVRLAGRREPSSTDLPAEDGDLWRAGAQLPRRQAQAGALGPLPPGGARPPPEGPSILASPRRTPQVPLQTPRAPLTVRLGLPAREVGR